MKRLSFLFLTVFFAFSCTDDALVFKPPVTKPPKPPVINNPTPNLNINLSSYRSAVASLVNYQFNETQVYTTVYDAQYVYFDKYKICLNAITTLNSTSGIPNFDMESLASTISNRINVENINDAAFSITNFDSNVSSTLTADQINTLNIYFNDVVNVTNVTESQAIYTSITAGINRSGSPFTQEQKILLLAYIETTNEFLKGYFSGQYDVMINELLSAIGVPNARTAVKCSIRTRDVLRAAVEGGIVGGATGAYIGATGGTVTLPLVGTVTGGVGGGVFGFTGGFVGGALTSVAFQTFWNCLMMSPLNVGGQNDPLCGTIEAATRNYDHCQLSARNPGLYYAITGTYAGG